MQPALRPSALALADLTWRAPSVMSHYVITVAHFTKRHTKGGCVLIGLAFAARAAASTLSAFAFERNFHVAGYRDEGRHDSDFPFPDVPHVCFGIGPGAP